MPCDDFQISESLLHIIQVALALKERVKSYRFEIDQSVWIIYLQISQQLSCGAMKYNKIKLRDLSILPRTYFGFAKHTYYCDPSLLFFLCNLPKFPFIESTPFINFGKYANHSFYQVTPYIRHHREIRRVLMQYKMGFVI